MAVDFSKNVFELFSGKKRTRPGTTLAIACVVTTLVAGPLIYRAIAADDEPAAPAVLAPADPDALVVAMGGGEPTSLDEATVSGPLFISLRDERASAASFRLFAAGADQPIIESQDVDGPEFDLIVGDGGAGEAFDSTLLADGSYELFVTLRTEKEDQRTAVSFTVANP